MREGLVFRFVGISWFGLMLGFKIPHVFFSDV